MANHKKAAPAEDKAPEAEAVPVSLQELQEENDRLRAELDNARLKLELSSLQAQIGPEWEGSPFPPLENIPTDTTPRPFGPGGAPVPRAPITPSAPKGTPKQGDIVNMACRTGAIVRATGQKCDGRQATMSGIVNNGDGLSGAGGRRVIYVCTTCNQPWHVVY